jgi:ArsR family transcriptional regulator, arsenate/arsenite/antimonite-responsive transcriptional repressor
MAKIIADREKIQEQAALFKALADPTRLKLLRLLSEQHAPDALCVNALAGLLGVTQSAISQHLRILKNISLVNGERRGYHVHYSINRQTLKSCQKLMAAALTIIE